MERILKGVCLSKNVKKKPLKTSIPEKRNRKDFKAEAVRQRRVIKKTEEFIDSLPIHSHFKFLFMELTNTRGFQDIEIFRQELIDIAENYTYVTLLFMDGKKMIGIETLWAVSVKMTEAEQVEYYECVSKNGVKGCVAEFNTILLRGASKTLLDFI